MGTFNAVIETTHLFKDGLKYTHVIHTPVKKSPFNIWFPSGRRTYKHLWRVTYMLKIVRLSIRPGRTSPWRLFSEAARKVSYSTLKQAMTLPKYKYVDVSLPLARFMNTLVSLVVE